MLDECEDERIVVLGFDLARENSDGTRTMYPPIADFELAATLTAAAHRVQRSSSRPGARPPETVSILTRGFRALSQTRMVMRLSQPNAESLSAGKPGERLLNEA